MFYAVAFRFGPCGPGAPVLWVCRCSDELVGFHLSCHRGRRSLFRSPEQAACAGRAALAGFAPSIRSIARFAVVRIGPPGPAP